MRQYFIILLRSTRSMALWNNSIIKTPSILKKLQWPMIVILLTVFSFSPAAFAIDITFAWKAVEEPEVEGYKLYYSVDWSGPPYDGLHPFYPHLDSPIDVGNVTEYTLHDLEEGVVYYFVVTVYDSEGNESEYSNQVSTADMDNSDVSRSARADKDNPDISRSAWSDNSETEAIGCFIQSSK